MEFCYAVIIWILLTGRNPHWGRLRQLFRMEMRCPQSERHDKRLRWYYVRFPTEERRRIELSAGGNNKKLSSKETSVNGVCART
jgi:hypothetical protein